MQCPKFHNREYLSSVSAVKFHYGAYLGETVAVSIIKEGNAFTLEITARPSVSIDGFKRNLSEAEWEEILETLFQELAVQEWEEQYDRLDVLDGADWTFEIYLTEGNICRTSGHNAFPPNWEGLANLFTPYLREAEVPLNLL